MKDQKSTYEGAVETSAAMELSEALVRLVCEHTNDADPSSPKIIATAFTAAIYEMSRRISLPKLTDVVSELLKDVAPESEPRR